jgi:hypothetical protein
MPRWLSPAVAAKSGEGPPRERNERGCGTTGANWTRTSTTFAALRPEETAVVILEPVARLPLRKQASEPGERPGYRPGVRVLGLGTKCDGKFGSRSDWKVVSRTFESGSGLRQWFSPSSARSKSKGTSAESSPAIEALIAIEPPS